MPVGVGRLPVPLAAVGALKPRLLAALVPEMRQHVRLLAERAAALRAKIPLNVNQLRLGPDPWSGRQLWKNQADHATRQ